MNLALIALIAWLAWLWLGREWTVFQFLSDSQHKLRQLAQSGAPTHHLHHNSGIVHLLANHRELGLASPDNYQQAIRLANRFIQLAQQIANQSQHLNSPGEQFQRLEIYKRALLNRLHNLIYGLPTHTDHSLQSLLSQAENLLNQQLDQAYRAMRQHYGKQGINTQTKFIYPHQPRPVDQASLHTLGALEYF